MTPHELDTFKALTDSLAPTLTPTQRATLAEMLRLLAVDLRAVRLAVTPTDGRVH